MNRTRKFRFIPVLLSALILCLGAFAQSPGKIDISKMNPAGLLVDKYSYMAQGIYGQCIYVNPARHVVIVQTSAWPEPVSTPLAQERKLILDKLARDIAP